MFREIFRVFIFLTVLPAAASATIHKIEIGPSQTGKGILRLFGPHIAGYESGVQANGFLVLSLSGTTGPTEQFMPFDEAAAALGYQFLALDYANGTSTVVCREHASEDCFDHFHEAVVEGLSSSPYEKVNYVNSIENRVHAALVYLLHHDGKRWAPFFQNGEVNWRKIVLAGHSQGTGHAAYLSKLHRVHRLILLAGLQDSTDRFGIAHWVSAPSATPPGQIFALLHRRDFFGYNSQLAALKVLRSSPEQGYQGASLAEPSFDDKQIFVTNHIEADPHMSLITSTYVEIWRQMLENSHEKIADFAI